MRAPTKYGPIRFPSRLLVIAVAFGGVADEFIARS
jgi:hypothetical protein